MEINSIHQISSDFDQTESGSILEHTTGCIRENRKAVKSNKNGTGKGRRRRDMEMQIYGEGIDATLLARVDSPFMPVFAGGKYGVRSTFRRKLTESESAAASHEMCALNQRPA